MGREWAKKAELDTARLGWSSWARAWLGVFSPTAVAAMGSLTRGFRLRPAQSPADSFSCTLSSAPLRYLCPGGARLPLVNREV
jgi:hypothetical protein